ncbi:MAG: hypothetical protein ACW99U_18385 [Candidatus Thorarchaeota archaeon]|jgi:hypothetical protein
MKIRLNRTATIVALIAHLFILGEAQGEPDPWNLTLDGIPVDPRLVAEGTQLTADYTMVCMSEYNYSRVANFIMSGVAGFDEILQAQMGGHIQICEDSKRQVRETFAERLKLRDTEIESLKKSLESKDAEIGKQAEGFESKILYHRIGLAGAGVVVILLSAILLR